MYLIIGLGNPGAKYLNNRHNVGFWLIDYWHHLENYPEFKEKSELNAEISKGENIIFAKPKTFMNLSGEAVQKIMHYFKIPVENLVIIYDDIDLPLGEIRFREEGSAGTHNGMRSVIQSLSTNEFKRLRIGIENRPEELKNKIDLSDYVLQDFREEEGTLIREKIKEGISLIKEKINLPKE